MHAKMTEDASLDEVLKEYEGHPEFRTSPRDVNARGADNSILNIAAYRGNLRHVRVLVKCGADVNFRGDMGYTPLHDAVASKNIKIVEYLLESGADASIRNEFGQTPHEYAMETGLREIAVALRRFVRRARLK